MIPHPLLKRHLEPLWLKRRNTRLWAELTVAWALAALVALGLLGLEKTLGWSSTLALPAASIVGLLLGTLALVRSRRRAAPDWRALALEIEEAHPELQGRLLTAVQQEPGGRLDYMQERLILESLGHSRTHDWNAVFPHSRIVSAQVMQFCMLALFGFALWQLRVPPGHGLFVPIADLGIIVTPGDTDLELGSSVTVAARFNGALPAGAELVYGPLAGTNSRLQLVRSLGDPLFAGTVQEVATDLAYHIEYSGKRSRDYRIKVFEYPRLQRADADVQYPEYTGMAPRRVENVRRVSAVEGSRVDLQLQLNKAVARATLVSKDTNRNEVHLTVSTNSPVATLADLVMDTSKTYELRLVDAEGRTNKLPAQFVFDALKNRAPELKIALPRGDTQPSALEELAFEGTVFDDFGVHAFGLASAVAGRDIQMIELGQQISGKEKRSFKHLLRMEDLGLQAGDLMSWFVWADDIGPDGKIRRTTGDLFFAEVRPFEEIFREGQSSSQDSQQQQQQQGQGGQSEKLAELQKQIINATWKLFRQTGQTPTPAAPAREPERTGESNRSSSIWPIQQDSEPAGIRQGVFGQVASDPAIPPRSRAPNPRQPRPGREPELAGDLGVVRSAQERALEQAQEAGQNGQDPRSADLWEAVTKQMERALEKLCSATNSPAEFQSALAAEQAAYQALLKLQEREFSVSRSRSQQGSQSGRQQQMQQQLDQLELAREENRYESERLAQPPQDPERSEDLQVLNRLQELARRQQDLNERLKEMQTALQEARTEQEREEIRRELKRLQEEQQQLLADADEVRDRMERPENQSRMSEQSRQMEQIRKELQKAAEAAQQGETSQALAAGTRAQRELQQMRDEMRRQSASQFEEDLRQMRSEARELAHQQEEVQKKMETLKDPNRRSLSDSDLEKQALEQLAAQRQRLTNLVDHATQLSRDAEEAEPLMSKELYETLRKFSTDETSTAKQFQEEFLNRPNTTRSVYERLKQTTEQSNSKSLDLTSEMLRLGLHDDASIAQERARAGIEDLKRGVERAAQSVLGDDAQSLRLASEELERLAEQLQREIAQGEGGGTNATKELAQAGSQSREARQPRESGQQGQAEEQGQQDEAAQSEQRGQRGQVGQEGQSGQAGRRDSENDQTENQQQDGQRSGTEEREPARAGQGQQPGGRNQPSGGEPSEQGQGEGTDQARQQEQQRGGAGNRGEGGRESTTPNQQRGGNRPQTAQRPGGGGGGGFSMDLDRLLGGRGGYDGAPITGEDFAPWSDRLREVEELVDTPSLRSEVTRARERARQMRQDYRRNQKKPEWADVRLQVLKPLLEVRNEIVEELARREPRENLVPIDRDPVPGRYSELVRRYYEQLGRANGGASSAQEKSRN